MKRVAALSRGRGLLANLSLGLLACGAAPAFAQNAGDSELLGGPGYRSAEAEAARQAAARRQVEREIAEARAKAKREADQAAEKQREEAPSPEIAAPRERLDERTSALRLDASIDACAVAGEDKAIARDYLAARYVRAPRFFERSRLYEGVWELRGVMRVEDWRGEIIADTVCELDADGRVQHFAFLRR